MNNLTFWAQSLFTPFHKRSLDVISLDIAAVVILRIYYAISESVQVYFPQSPTLHSNLAKKPVSGALLAYSLYIETTPSPEGSY